MKEKLSEGISFANDIYNFDFTASIGMVVHILCLEGSLSFTRNNTRFNVSAGDYVILTPGIGVTDMLFSNYVKTLIMFFPESVALTLAIRSNYGVFGHLSLIENPVLRLNQDDFRRCRKDMENICDRNSETGHIFHEEMIGALLKAHILDIYNIHARSGRKIEINSQPARIMRSFIEMLMNGNYTGSRKLDRYASELCITPHYLTEISKKTSGQPASYWIELFLIRAATVVLMQSDRTLQAISESLSFSSLSHFSRFVKSKIGMTPTQFRNQFRKDRRRPIGQKNYIIY